MSARSASAYLGAWQEVIQVFLQLAAREPGKSSVLHLAAALGRFFPSCHLIVLSYTTQKPAGPSWEGAGWSGEEPWLMTRDDAERQSASCEALDRKITASGYSLCFKTAADLPWVLVLVGSPQLSSSVEWRIGIVIQEVGVGLRDHIADRFGWLRRYLEGMPALATAHIAVSRSQEKARRAQELALISELRGEVANFARNEEATASKRLELGQQIAGRIKESLDSGSDPEHLRLARDLAEAALQRLLGNGRDLRRSEDGRLDAIGRPFIETLQSLQKSPAFPEDEGLRHSLLWLNLNLQAAIVGAVSDIPAAGVTPAGLPDEARQSVLELAQLAFWSSVHQEALARLQTDELAISSAAWEPWRHRIQAALANLQRVLQNRFRHEAGSSLRVKLLPAWLRLWFCGELARVACGREKPEDWSRWQLWAHLAYVIRETLRSLAYGRRTDYKFQPLELAVALRTVVEHHAIHVVGLPSDPDIRALLHEVSQMNAADGYLFAAGHLQHVLEVYIAGQFLCDIDISLEGATWTMEDILASRSSWQPGKLSRHEFRKAFSLAALLHDIGRLLLPRSSQPAARWGRVDSILLRELVQVNCGLQGAVGHLTEHCADELRRQGYFDPHAEPAIEDWIAERLRRKEADPALVSAWFLHRLCQNVEGLQNSTMKQAVRAVLLHRLVTQPIQVDNDPAAALLVTCDQIFTWNVVPGGLPPGEAGHSIQALAADLKPSASLFRRIELYRGGSQSRRLALEQDLKTGRLWGRIPEEALGGSQPAWKHSWPHFVLELREPESLETPVYWIWLSLAQNLGRIVCSGKRNWAPVVTIRSRLIEGQATTLDLLRRIADRSSLRPALERWLDTVAKEGRHRELKEKVSADRSDRFEEIILGPLDRLLHREDICDIFPELDTLAKEIRSRARPRS
jgi:hypothetical protein